MRWALTQPESVLGINEAFLEIDQVYYSLGHSKYVGDPWQANLVRDETNAILENIVKALNDELEVAFSSHFNMDENNRKAIDVLETVRMIVAQAASRFTVGLPLCKCSLTGLPDLAVIDLSLQAAMNSTSEIQLMLWMASLSMLVLLSAPLSYCDRSLAELLA